MRLMTRTARRSAAIMANKTDLEDITFPVNVVSEHQRVERVGRKCSEQGERAQREIYCRRRRKVTFGERGGGLGVEVFSRVFAGFPWSLRCCRPHWTHWSQGGYRRATEPPELCKYDPCQFRASVLMVCFQGPQGKDGPVGPRGPLGPMVSSHWFTPDS